MTKLDVIMKSDVDIANIINCEEKRIALIGNPWKHEQYPTLFKCGDRVVAINPTYYASVPRNDRGYSRLDNVSEFEQSTIDESKEIINRIRNVSTNTLVLTDDFYISKIYNLSCVEVKEVRMCELP